MNSNLYSINDIKEVLSRFQKGFIQKDIEQLDSFVKEMFSSKDGLVVLGNGLNQWAYNQEETKTLLQQYWSNENNYWDKIDFRFEDARIFAEENIAWAVSLGRVRKHIKEEELFESTIDKITEILSRGEKSVKNILEASRAAARSLMEMNKGEEFQWPFRWTAVLIKEDDVWKFHHMQFSLDSCYFWYYRFTDENLDESLTRMPKSSRNKETEEIREVLRKFQDGYTKKDISIVDDYMRELFTLDEDMVVIGTDADELCVGPEAAKGIVSSDWQYWGDFELNAEEAFIEVSDNTAYFITKAVLRRTLEQDVIYDGTSVVVKDYIFKEEDSPKGKMLKALFTMLMRLHEAERGERYVAPMRFSGVLVKRDGKWLIHHLQYSDPIEGMPEARKFGQ